ncbi:histidinol phosphate phosphatase [Clostridia bacterium]|nr:histidinol phosphate phosphatase [Clostridia bacterium]
MFLADYHTHSVFSHDGKDGIDLMAASARAAGVDELAVTDHCDLISPGKIYGKYDQRGYFDGLASARAEGKDTPAVLAGLELGQAHHAPEDAEAILSGGGYDFVLGSVHWLRDGTDFCRYDYSSAEKTREILDRYFGELLELAAMPRLFDVLSHLTLPLRYMPEPDAVDIRLFEPALRRLFKLLADSGRGIEVNTAGGAVEGTLPDAWCVSLFRECGGEIITVGSDAHVAGDIGRHVKETYALLRGCGFTRITTFRERKPIFIKL